MAAKKEVVAKLVKLQSVLKEAFDLDQTNKLLPLSVAEMRKRIEPMRSEIEGSKKEQQDLQARSGEIETEMGIQEDRLQEINRRMNAVSKTRELEAVEAEQSSTQARIESLRDEQGGIRSRLEALKKKLVEMEPEYAVHEERISAEEARVQEEMDKNKGRIQVLNETRETMVVGIDFPTLNKFERILKSKNGIGIVPVIQGSCDGCHMKVPPQMVAKVRSGQEIITCLICSRMLYIPDETGDV
jgi:hypothetical protein